jgi:hypothetical protein
MTARKKGKKTMMVGNMPLLFKASLQKRNPQVFSHHPIKIVKKPVGLIWFYKQKTEKIKPKPKKPGKNRTETEKIKPNWKHRVKPV